HSLRRSLTDGMPGFTLIDVGVETVYEAMPSPRVKRFSEEDEKPGVPGWVRRVRAPGQPHTWAAHPRKTCRFRHAQLARSKARTDLHRRRRRLRQSPT